ncbi:MAG: hypothetical protein KDD27_24305 [Saprospiraceae bacterium]|nr:hypothetical protein [Saprospiraceae bacterium]
MRIINSKQRRLRIAAFFAWAMFPVIFIWAGVRQFYQVHRQECRQNKALYLESAAWAAFEQSMMDTTLYFSQQYQQKFQEYEAMEKELKRAESALDPDAYQKSFALGRLENELEKIKAEWKATTSNSGHASVYGELINQLSLAMSMKKSIQQLGKAIISVDDSMRVAELQSQVERLTQEKAQLRIELLEARYPSQQSLKPEKNPNQAETKTAGSQSADEVEKCRKLEESNRVLQDKYYNLIRNIRGAVSGQVGSGKLKNQKKELEEKINKVKELVNLP